MAKLNFYEIDSIYMALHELSKGRLSHHLVNSTSLAAGIRDISWSGYPLNLSLFTRPPIIITHRLRWEEQSTKNPTLTFC